MGQKQKQRSEDWKKQKIQKLLVVEINTRLYTYSFNKYVQKGLFVLYQEDDKVLV